MSDASQDGVAMRLYGGFTAFSRSARLTRSWCSGMKSGSAKLLLALGVACPHPGRCLKVRTLLQTSIMLCKDILGAFENQL